MKWSTVKQSVDCFWERLESEVQASRERFPILSRPAVHVSLLALLAIVFCLGGLSANKILEGDEALYALVPKTIVVTGDWNHLTYNGQPYFYKPPLNFWITAAFFHVLPMNAFTASLGSGLFGALSALMIYAMCRVMFAGWELPFASALVFLTTHEVLHWTRGVHLETILNLSTLTGLLCAYLSVKHPAAILGLGLSAALGWLAKGPQSLYPGAVALILWYKERLLWRRLFSFWSVGSALLLVAPLAPWLWVRLNEGTGFGHGYFVGEIAATLFKSQSRNGPFYYFMVLPQTYWPWLPAALFGYFILYRGRQRSLGARLWLAFTAVVWIILLATVEKRARYLFQLYPAFSVAAGAAVVFAVQRYPRVLRVFVALALVAALGFLVFARKNIAGSATTRESLIVARRLHADDRVWLTRRIAQGERHEPSVAKSLGFYAAPLLRTCAQQCQNEATPGSFVIARSEEGETVAKLIGGRVAYANRTVALIAAPGAPER